MTQAGDSREGGRRKFWGERSIGEILDASIEAAVEDADAWARANTIVRFRLLSRELRAADRFDEFVEALEDSGLLYDLFDEFGIKQSRLYVDV